MKILYITNGIHGAGGLERVLSIKAGYLADKLDHEVHILTLNAKGAPVFYEFSPKIHFHDIIAGGNPITYTREYVNGIREVVNKVRPQIISVCDDGLKGFFLPKVLPKTYPIIYERHVSKIIELGAFPSTIRKLKVRFKFFLMNLLAKNFDRFVVLTRDNISEWNLKNIIVISNPLSFNPSDSSPLNHNKVIAVGKQSHQKGFDLLLQSWVAVQEKHPDWKLEIYGKFEPSLGLEALARKLGVQETVTFFPPEKAIMEKYLQSDVFALSSRFEGFGMVLTEAMICGVPCVSFDCPCGPRDIIMDGEDGFLVENGDTEKFGERILDLIENPQLRLAMGGKAKENVKRYLPETIVAQWDELFKSLAR